MMHHHRYPCKEHAKLFVVWQCNRQTLLPSRERSKKQIPIVKNAFEKLYQGISPDRKEERGPPARTTE